MRTAMKTATYGLMHMGVAMLVAYAVSGSWKIALGVGIIEPIVQVFFYHLHETAWANADAKKRESKNLHSFDAAQTMLRA